MTVTAEQADPIDDVATSDAGSAKEPVYQIAHGPAEDQPEAEGDLPAHAAAIGIG